MNPNNPTSREKQEHEDSGHAVYRNWCAACVEGRGVGGQHRIELLDEEERENDSHHGFRLRFSDTGNRRHVSNSDLSRQQVWSNGSYVLRTEGPTAYSISFLVGFIKDLGFRRIFSKCDNEPSTTSLQDAVIRACAGVEVIPRGPPVGDHMANVRVEIALREVKRCAEHSGFQLNNRQMYASQTTVRCSAGFTALRWKTSELRRTGRRWRKPMAPFGETVRFCKIGEDVVSSFARAHDLRILCLSS